MNSHLNCWFAAAIVGLFSTFAAQAADLIYNGGFEDPDVSGPYEHRNENELPGWTLSVSNWRGTVHFDTEYASVSEGSQAVQIEVPGDWISQSFPTVIGQDYTVSFDLSAFGGYGNPDPEGNCCESILGVTVGTIYEEFKGSSAGYSPNTLQFTADSSATTLKFENLGELNVWGNYPHLDNVSVTAVPPIIVTIDIKPGTDPNTINLRSKGKKVPVAILTTEAFDATTVDRETVQFAAASPLRWAVEDVDYDGDLDLVFYFKTQELNIDCGATEATLTGEIEGVSITGTDLIQTVGC